MLQWLRRSFIAGFFVTVPLFISLAAILWLFRVIDGFVAPAVVQLLGRQIPGLGIAITALEAVHPKQPQVQQVLTDLRELRREKEASLEPP